MQTLLQSYELFNIPVLIYCIILACSFIDKDHNIITTVSELEHDEHEGMDEMALKEHEEITKIKNISNVVFGRHEIECWYFSPFPKEYHPDGPVDFLYYCEFSMRFFRTKDELLRCVYP